MAMTYVLPIKVGEWTAELVMPDSEPAPDKLDVSFTVEDEAALRRVVKAVGGIQKFSSPEETRRLLAAYDVNEKDGVRVNVEVWLGAELAEQAYTRPPAPAVVLALLDEEQGSAEAEKQRAQEREPVDA